MKSVIAGTLLVGAGLGSWFELPERIEGWLFNPRERTEQGLEAHREEQPEAAATAFDSAARLAPDDPVAQFNAGTGRLLAERGDAAESLDRAAALAPRELRPRALFNLGNARLQGGDPAAAIESYKESLRLEPSQDDAKHNLELALKALAEQNSGQQGEQETPDAENPGEQEQAPSEGDEQPSDSEEPERDGSDPGEQDPDGDRQQPSDGDSKDRPLPDFEQQEDMTAEQAAAILEAVENLEREQRKAQAAERLKARKKGDRDW